MLSLDPELAELALERAAAEVRQLGAALADTQRRLDEAERVGPERGVPRTQIEEPLRSEVAIDEAALVVARAAASEQAATVERHRLKAPFAGVISQRFAELGEWVNPGDGLPELVATDNLRFDFRVPHHFGKLTERHAGADHAGCPARRVRVGARRGDRASQEPGRADLPVACCCRRRCLREPAGDYARHVSTCGIEPRDGPNRIVVSRDAILRLPDGRVTVWLVNTRDGVSIVHERIVRTGLEFDGFVEVKQGLEDGELVVTRGNESLQEDQAVAILGGGS